ncbi:hypothetical protein F2Q68_00016581 [Brassica cretica]|uniref:Uncharacterized protein n=1 Tax=Brassica cretica TaxID=69181 RepID=A0A8S9HIC1_BRACR|nr:hypothetical protein F2Q68_00016581 [Brassica cretica]
MTNRNLRNKQRWRSSTGGKAEDGGATCSSAIGQWQGRAMGKTEKDNEVNKVNNANPKTQDIGVAD